MVYFSAHLERLDEDSRRRLHSNPLRILDSKDPGVQAMLADAPVLANYLGEASRSYFDGFLSLLDGYGLAYQVNPRLVRGLDYYSHAVFEWITDELGAQGTVCAGGRYDGLVEIQGGRIGVTSVIGEGATFMIDLPAQPGAAHPAP